MAIEDTGTLVCLFAHQSHLTYTAPSWQVNIYLDHAVFAKEALNFHPRR